MNKFVHTETREEFYELIDLYEKMGWLWHSWNWIRTLDAYTTYGACTCIEFCNWTSYCNTRQCRDYWWEVIPFSEAKKILEERLSASDQIEKVEWEEDSGYKKPKFIEWDRVKYFSHEWYIVWEKSNNNNWKTKYIVEFLPEVWKKLEELSFDLVNYTRNLWNDSTFLIVKECLLEKIRWDKEDFDMPPEFKWKKIAARVTTWSAFYILMEFYQRLWWKSINERNPIAIKYPHTCVWPELLISFEDWFKFVADKKEYEVMEAHDIISRVNWHNNVVEVISYPNWEYQWRQEPMNRWVSSSKVNSSYWNKRISINTDACPEPSREGKDIIADARRSPTRLKDILERQSDLSKSFNSPPEENKPFSWSDYI